MKYRVLFMDMDDTLLSFKEASFAAFNQIMNDANLPYNEKMFHRYEEINLSYWQALERGETTLEELNSSRFQDYLNEHHLEGDPDMLGNQYLYQLSFQHATMPDMEEVLIQLRKWGYRIYVTTNGEANTQNRRYRDSHLNELTDGMFISEEVGYKKPNLRYFEIVNETVQAKKEEILLIGDSLTSDIKGGIQFGIDTCWMVPKEKENTTDIHPTYRISSLLELLDLLKPE